MTARGHEWADYWLTMWSGWQQTETVGRGYPRRSAGLSTGGHGWEDIQDETHAVELMLMPAIDSAVHDCQPIHAAAIMCAYGVAAVFRFRTPVSEVLPGALDEFERIARAKGVM